MYPLQSFSHGPKASNVGLVRCSLIRRGCMAGGVLALAASMSLAIEPQEPYEPVSPPLVGITPNNLGLQGTFVSTDVKLARQELPPPALQQPNLTASSTAWRGERVNLQVALWSTNGCGHLRVEAHSRGAFPENIQPHFIRYTRGEGGALTPDILDDATLLDLPAGTTRPLWISIDVPRDAAPGDYQLPFAVAANGAKKLSFQVKLQVLAATLPVPHDWTFHLDLWQNPFAVARYHRVKLWSPEHFAVLEPHMKLLANGGGKVLTASIVHQPWGTQTYDPYQSMIEWIKQSDGTWRYDYTVFDQWVEFGSKCGMDHQINCYSLIPWSNRFRYRDEVSGDYRDVDASPGTQPYEEHLRPFLRDFCEHLKKKGWFERTHIAMDERPLPVMLKLLAFLKKEAPGLKVASAANYTTELSDDIADLSIAIRDGLHLSPEALRKRSASGHFTTFYVCCVPDKPNTFMRAAPAEAEWLGLHAAARRFDGMLRWTYDSWVADPLQDTNHVNFPPGDCFIVYPGGRSSVRFERLRAGIEGYEKIRILRAAAARPTASPAFADAMQTLEVALANINFDKGQHGKVEAEVQAAREAIDAAAREMVP